jgi:hypothetical protein
LHRLREPQTLLVDTLRHAGTSQVDGERLRVSVEIYLDKAPFTDNIPSDHWTTESARDDGACRLELNT